MDDEAAVHYLPENSMAGGKFVMYTFSNITKVK